ncbi:hypothetical protein DFH09DRAFT_1084821 [Mycena vulgaris]|nr:hypothetical protein DFH09DRAFT_1084821 [Mycena vulgaris]
MPPATFVSGLPLPNAIFDFKGWRTQPAPLLITENMDLKDRNQHNHNAELVNRTSTKATRKYETALLTTPADGIAGIDVGNRLIPYYEYTPEEIDFMVASPEYCDKVVNPLPMSTHEYCLKKRLEKKQLEYEGKLKKDKEREEKEKDKAMPLLGSLVTSTPRFLSTTSRDVPSVPIPFLTAIKNQYHVPLYWFSDSKLRLANTHPHDIALEKITPAASAEDLHPEKVSIVNISKLMKTWGSDEDTTHLTPHSFNLSSRNLLAGLEALCDTSSSLKLQKTSDFTIWYEEERKLRICVPDHYQFDEVIWSSKVNTVLSAHKAALKMFGTMTAKRANDSDLRPGPQKLQKTGLDSDPSRQSENHSFRNSFHEQEPPRGPRTSGDRPPTCLICAGPQKNQRPHIQHHKIPP